MLKDFFLAINPYVCVETSQHTQICSNCERKFLWLRLNVVCSSAAGRRAMCPQVCGLSPVLESSAFFLAPAEGCSLRMQTVGPFGPTFSRIFSGNFFLEFFFRKFFFQEFFFLEIFFGEIFFGEFFSGYFFGKFYLCNFFGRIFEPPKR